jgi:trimeric autotransporter adhesin
MIRQAHSYLVGAVSGAVLIAAAVVVFILLLISTQGFRDLPIVGFGGDESASVAPARPLSPAGSARAGGLAGARNDRSDRSVSVPREDSLSASGTQGATSPPSGNPGGGGGANPSPGSAPIPSSGVGSGSGSNPSDGGGSAGNSGNSVSGTVVGTANDTVNGVDHTLGGALDRTGITGVTPRVVDGVPGPSSPVGQAVDRTADAVGGLLDSNR